MASSNLFKQLYSKDNAVQQSGFVCSNASNIDDTSFDISGNKGTVTDSNGNELASIPLDLIHAAGITQYNIETRILQPYSCYVLQGQEYGLAMTTYYFELPVELIEFDEWDKYVNVEFDMVYNQYDHRHLHVECIADGVIDLCQSLNDYFTDHNINVTVNVQDVKDPIDNSVQTYLCMQAGTEGYFFYVKNVQMTAAVQSEEYPGSPFSTELDSPMLTIHSLITEYHPVIEGDEYSEETYEVDCELYNWFLTNMDSIIENHKAYEEHLDYLVKIEDTEEDLQYYTDGPCYNEDGTEMSEEVRQEAIKDLTLMLKAYEAESLESITDTPYEYQVIQEYYDYDNKVVINDIILALINEVKLAEQKYENIFWLPENIGLRVPTMKYPNGALRGIVLIPEFPDMEDYEFSSLWVNHIQTTVDVYKPVKEANELNEILYTREKFGVMSNAMFKHEAYCHKDPHGHHGHHPKFQSNVQLKTDILDGWDNAGESHDHNYPNKPEGCGHDDYSYDLDHLRHPKRHGDIVYLGESCYSDKTKIMGLYGYMRYVSDHNMWTRIGECYMAIAKEDNPQSFVYNLLPSVMVYNPNDIPVRVHYLIFS